MIVAAVRVRNFRNHRASSLEFGEGINALLGDNGEGKTNILEAISYLSLTKSFYASADATVLRIGEEGFEIEGSILSAGGVAHAVRVVYDGRTGTKDYEINGARPERLSSVIGRFPIVILSPENGAITFGGPMERRRFMDLILSQLSPAYLETLFEYRRIVRQRNRVLLDARMRGSQPERLLAPWNESLALQGSILVHRRRSFVEEFAHYMVRAYGDLVEGGGETPGVRYESSCRTGNESVLKEAIAEEIRGLLRQYQGEELKRGTTLVGPHRDNLVFTLAGVPVQQYASQGQHKSLLVALKVAEFTYLRERREERPIFLLDDVFSELDQRRSARILHLAGTLGQTIITTTDVGSFGNAVAWNEANRRFTVERGTCRRET
jgi:DNA replication and repair protein RecF